MIRKLAWPPTPAHIFSTRPGDPAPKGVVDSRNVLHNVMRYTNSLGICADERLTLAGSELQWSRFQPIWRAVDVAAIFPFDVPRDGADRIAAWLERDTSRSTTRFLPSFAGWPKGPYCFRDSEWSASRVIRLRRGTSSSLRRFARAARFSSMA